MIDLQPIPVNLARRLIYTVNRYQQYLLRRLKQYGIGSSEYPVLIYLVHREDESNGAAKVSQSDIAQVQHRDPALITRAARSLAAKGLITVSQDPDNRARNVLRLTAEGRAAAAKVEELVSAWEDQAQADLTKDEQDQLENLLSRLQLPS